MEQLPLCSEHISYFPLTGSSSAVLFAIQLEMIQTSSGPLLYFLTLAFSSHSGSGPHRFSEAGLEAAISCTLIRLKAHGAHLGLWVVLRSPWIQVFQVKGENRTMFDGLQPEERGIYSGPLNSWS